MSFMRTAGKDLTGTANPYLERDIKFSNMEQIRDRILAVSYEKYGAKGAEELSKVFKDMDRNKNGTIDPVEFKYCMRVWGVEFTEEEIT